MQDFEKLYNASSSLFYRLSDKSTEFDLIQSGVEELISTLNVHYGAIALLNPAGKLTHFFYAGMTLEEVSCMEHLPEGRGLLAAVIKENKTLNVKDISKDSRSVGYPKNHPVMKSLLAVPISYENRIYGRIYLCDKKNGKSFTKHDEKIMENYASLLSSLLDTVQRIDRINLLRADLEQGHTAVLSLLKLLSATSIEEKFLQSGIETLTQILKTRYGAIGLVNKAGKLTDFIYTGIKEKDAEQIDHTPEGKGLLGVVINENTILRLKDMTLDPRSAGFPEHHPPMKTLLAVPVAYNNTVYGRIYLSDRRDKKPFDEHDELLVRSFAHTLALVLNNMSKMDELEATYGDLQSRGNLDALTGLPNRAMMRDRLELAILHAKRHKTMLAVLFLDLDSFKDINDTLGHKVGDDTLKILATRFKNVLRSSDTISREGGDEFLMLLPDLHHSEDILYIINKIFDIIKLPIIIDSNELYLKVSIGITIYPEDADNADMLITRADLAMYRAKKLGTNRYHFYKKEMQEEVSNKLLLEEKIRTALVENEFVLHYQPQVNLKTGQVIGAEALIRWMHPGSGLIMPGDFIPLAEEKKLIIPMGNWVIKTACLQIKAWKAAGFNDLTMSINLSACHFRDPNLLPIIQSTLDEVGLSGSSLEIELTETAIMEDIDEAIIILNNLKKLGISIALDDFGTHYSCLNYLKNFPIDRIKIDQSFITDVVENSKSEAIVHAIIELSHGLGLKVIAEGVETKEQLALMKKLTCEEIQGYYYCRALPENKFKTFIKKSIKKPLDH